MDLHVFLSIYLYLFINRNVEIREAMKIKKNYWRIEDAILPALKMEEGATSQEMQVASGS